MLSHLATVHSDLCADCGTVLRTYVTDLEHKGEWATYDQYNEELGS